ncbi:hypothetical protein CcCBS67573_g09676 [Chytriomyces confervae]|uniref:DNA ligase 4 n=1 Tax=Chytriomyces confervae TaxID=246404 RepID=A0A507DPQ6_9FUNG|nr:hypothetical protein CcCBS67573_g09676 [Chytriomyces confervae]
MSEFETSVPFSTLSKTLDRIQRTSGHRAKRDIAATLMGDRNAQRALVMMRLVLPHLDHERVLGVKEKMLAKMYAEVLGIEGTPDAARLADWRNPLNQNASTATGANHHDFPQTLFSVVRDRILSSVPMSSGSGRSRGGLTVADVDAKISELAAADNYIDRKAVISYFINRLTPTEHKWLARIILKDMKLGITEKTLFDTWHPEAQDLYNITSSLTRVANDLSDLSVSLISSSKVSLNFPFKPMLSKMVKSLESVPRLMKTKPFWIEAKLDGERLQLHKSGGNYKWFSRNAKDYTHLYGSYKDEKIAQYVHSAMIPQVESCVLDGEMMSLNSATGLFESFGALKTAANLFGQHGDAASSKPVFMVFDLLFYNGKSLLDSPLKDRYKLLSSVLRDQPGKIELLKHVEGTTTEDVVRALDASMINHEEGIVIKNPEAFYLMNDRGGDWLKVKPDYIDSLGDDIDLVLVGGFYGTGRRGGKLSHFMCAVVDDSSDSAERRYITFCKFGSGYTLSQIDEIAHEASGHWQPFDPRSPPSWLIHPPQSKEKPDMILHPRYSRVVSVKAAEVVESTQYAAGFTLRFPRFVNVRLDKSIEGGALTRSGLDEYIMRNKGRMQSRRFGGVEGGGDGGEDVKTNKRNVPARSIAMVAAEYQAVKIEGTVKVDDLMSGVEVCVINGSVAGPTGECMKHALEREVIKHGGTCVQNPRADKTGYVIADKSILKVSNLIKEGVFNIVKSKWLLDCVTANKLIPLQPRYMVYASEKTVAMFKRVNDKYGDSFTLDVSVADLKEIIKSVPPVSASLKRKGEENELKVIRRKNKHGKLVAAIEQRYAPYLLDSDVSSSNERRILRNLCVYLDVYDVIRVAKGMLERERELETDGKIVVVDGTKDSKLQGGDTEGYKSLHSLDPIIKLHGGQVASVFGSWTTHVVLAAGGEEDIPLISVQEQQQREDEFLQLLLRYPHRHTHRPNIVTSRWIKDQIESA